MIEKRGNKHMQNVTLSVLNLKPQCRTFHPRRIKLEHFSALLAKTGV